MVQILNHLPLLTPDLSSHKYRIEEVLGYYQRSSCKTCSYVVSIFLVLPPDELIEEATHEAGELSKQYVQNLFTFHESWYAFRLSCVQVISG